MIEKSGLLLLVEARFKVRRLAGLGSVYKEATRNYLARNTRTAYKSRNRTYVTILSSLPTPPWISEPAQTNFGPVSPQDWRGLSPFNL